MDFGILYMPNKAASQAAMGLGCFVFLFCILIPYIVCWAFVPLYLILLILGAIRGFKVENPAFTFLFPLVPFTAACVLCIVFWWAIPAIVNFSNDLLDLINPFYDGNILFRDSIPDDKCFLYFIEIIGGSIGVIFSIISIGSLFEKKQTIDNYYYPESLARIRINVASDFCPLIKDVEADYKNGLITNDEANHRIKQRFKQWAVENYDINKKDIECLWKSKKWLMEIK